jgi:hypothetical protein
MRRFAAASEEVDDGEDDDPHRGPVASESEVSLVQGGTRPLWTAGNRPHRWLTGAPLAHQSWRDFGGRRSMARARAAFRIALHGEQHFLGSDDKVELHGDWSCGQSRREGPRSRYRTGRGRCWMWWAIGGFAPTRRARVHEPAPLLLAPARRVFSVEPPSPDALRFVGWQLGDTARRHHLCHHRGSRADAELREDAAQIG